ncbi:MAG: hypothetical protein IT293_16460 [Deltaproteobacteria bacterium]|nr:hypothetical protein [Deltaproteobacteria bacterium]
MRRRTVLALVAWWLLGWTSQVEAFIPPAPAALERPDTQGDQLVFYYDARENFTTFLTVRNVMPGELTVTVLFYAPGFDGVPFAHTITLPAFGLRVLDVGELRASGLPAQAGAAFATGVNEVGTAIVSAALTGNFTVANLATGSAWGAPAAARSAVNADDSFPDFGATIDNQMVSLRPILPSGLDLSAYYNPDDLASSDLGGDQLIFVNFEDVSGLPLRAQVGATDWNVFAAGADGSTIADTGFTATGVVVTNLATVVGADVGGSSGSIRFTSFVFPPRATRLIFFAEALGTFGTGYLLPPVPTLL